MKLVTALSKGQSQELLQQLEALALDAPDYGQVLVALLSLLHQIAMTQWVPESCKLETTHARAIYQLAQTLSPETLQLYYQIALQGRRDLPYAVDGRSGLEMTLLRMLAFAPVEGEATEEKKTLSLTPGSVTRDRQQADDAAQLEAQQQLVLQQAQALRGPQPLADAAQTRAVTAQPVAQVAAPVPGALEPASGVANEALSEPSPLAPELRPVAPGPATLADSLSMLALRDSLKAPESVPAMEDSSAPSKQPSVKLQQKCETIGAYHAEFSGQATQVPSHEGDVLESVALDLAERDPPPWQITALKDSESVVQQSLHKAPAAQSLRPLQQDEEAGEQHRIIVENNASDDGDQMGLSPFTAQGDKVLHAAQLDSWSAIIKRAGLTGLVRQLALHSVFHHQGQQGALVLHEKWAHLDTPSARSQLQQALRPVLGEELRLTVTLGQPENTPFLLTKAIAVMRQKYAKECLDKDPMLALLRQEFGAKVQEDSIKAR